MAGAVDWPRFVRMVDRHRVQALAWHALTRLDIAIPTTTREALSTRSAAIVEQNLRAAVECARLRDGFEKAGVPLLFFKGLTLGALAYRNPYLKMSCDIDVLVSQDRVADAAALLLEAGYQPLLPITASGPHTVAAWHRLHKESVWRKAHGGVQLDLHTRLANPTSLLSDIGINSPRQWIKVTDANALHTLETDALVAYLCVHGASSSWFRLKWVSDLAALLHQATPDEIGRLYQYSQATGAGRSAAQAFLLCRRLFAIDLGQELAHRLLSRPINRVLERIAMRELTGRTDLKEPTDVRMGTAMIHCSQLLLVEGPRNKLGEGWRQLREALSTRMSR